MLHSLHNQRLRQQHMASAACSAVCSWATGDSSVDDRPCITTMPFNFGGFSLTQTYLHTDFSVSDYILS